MKVASFLAVCAFASSFAGAAMAQDGSAGEEIYQSVCKNCHGPAGKGMASFPKLTGNSADYIVQRLEAYRAGERVGPNSALMMPHAAELSDEDIAGLAAYITQLE